MLTLILSLIKAHAIESKSSSDLSSLEEKDLVLERLLKNQDYNRCC